MARAVTRLAVVRQQWQFGVEATGGLTQHGGYGAARQGLGRWWIGRLGLLLILAFFSPPSVVLFPRAGFRGGAGRICLLLVSFASFGGGRTLRQASPAFVLAGVSRGGSEAGLLLNHRRTLPPW
jgi:hypothetical protein